MRLTRCLLLALAGFFISLPLVESAMAQGQAGQKGIPSDGRDFYFAYKRTSFDCTTIQPYQSYWILISSYYDCNATISYFDAKNGGQEITDKTVHITAKNYQQIPINTGYTDPKDDATGFSLDIDGEKPIYTAIHVHADHPINVQYFSTGPDDCEMYLVLPTGALGKKYVVMASPNNDGTGAPTPARFCNNGGEPSSSYFGVIAVKDGTHVTIRPSATTRSGFPGATSGPNNGQGLPSPMGVTLQRGQVYWVKSWIKSNPGFWDLDETGSQIESDQPVAVVGGCENEFNGTTTLGFADMRNITLEMMVPYDYWTSSAYLFMPMFDSPGMDPADNSYGDQAKIVVGEKAQPGCLIHADITELGPRDYAVSPYQFPPAVQENVPGGATFYSPCDQKFGVEQYEYRGSGQTQPYTAPCQMNVVPASRYRTSYMWTVPNDPRQVKARRYVNVICRSDRLSKIKVYKNGLPVGSMGNVGALQTTTTFPDFPQMKGYRFEVAVGCYYATDDSAFAVYQYGMSGFDVDGDLGDFDADDFFNEYCAPCGQSFGIDGAGRPTITVDTICDGHPYWNVHVRDTAALDHFLSVVDILRDPLGVLKKRPDADTGYTSYNVDFDPTGFTVVPGLDVKEDVTIIVQNPLKNAEAWVWAVNGAGNDTLVHLVYIAPDMLFGAITSNGVDKNGDARLDFKNAQLGQDTCSWFVFKNATSAGGSVYKLKTVRFQLGGQGVFTANTFDAKGNAVPLPASLAPGDSVIVRVCFNPSQAGQVYVDTVLAETDCPFALGIVTGSTTVPEITASDYDFGPVVVGKTACHTVRVQNTGKAPFTLDSTWVFTHYVGQNFTFSDVKLLPHTLQPNESIDLNFCYTPTNDTLADSSIMVWGTNIPADFKTIKKNFSILKGLGIKPTLNWTTVDTTLLTQCDTVRTFRDTLFNNGTAGIIVGKIALIPDKAGDNQWQITDSKSGRQNNISLDKKELEWIDITFTPNLTALPNQGWTSTATIVALDDDSIKPIVTLHAIVSHADATANPATIDLGVVSPGQLSPSKNVTITNTGNAPLVIEAMTFSDPTFSADLAAGSATVGDVIPANKTKDIIIRGQTNNTLVTGTLTVKFATDCPPTPVIPLQISTAAITADGTPLSFNTTYECQTGVLVASTNAIGQGYKLVLTSAKIIDDPANPGQAGEFMFDTTGTSSLTMSDTLAGGDVRTYKVRYTPASTGTKHAMMEYTYHRADDPTIIITVDRPITGIGAVENTTVSLAKDPANPTAPYTALTGQTVTIPVTLLDPIATTANVYKATFDVTLAQDQFVAGSGGYFVGANGNTISAQPETDAGGIATVHVTLQSSTPITGGHVADLVAKVAVARARGTSIGVSNVNFYDQNDPTPLCYVAHNEIPAVFAPTDLCGDSTLRQYLITGKLRFSIGQVSPNPASNTVQVGLDVTDEGTPVTVELYNVTGDNVRTYSTSQNMSAGHQNLDLDLTGLPQGAYTLKVSAPGETGSQMILIQR